MMTHYEHPVACDVFRCTKAARWLVTLPGAVVGERLCPNHYTAKHGGRTGHVATPITYGSDMDEEAQPTD